jgi:CHAD domain-containing protein
MPYRFKRKENVAKGIRRIVVEQSEKAAAELGGDNPDIQEGVHNARKSFKKVRSLLRLARENLGDSDYKAENEWFRDAKNRLSSARDAEAMIETFDKLAERYPATNECPSLRSLHDALENRRDEIAGAAQDVEEVAQTTAQELRRVPERTRDWDLSKKDGFEVLGKGLARMYARGRKAMDKAYRKPSDELFHEWRKRVKDHWYHTRLLSSIWPEAMGPRVDELKRLSDLLGDDHDLAVLRETLEREDRSLEGDTATFTCLAQRRQGELRAEARGLGERLYAKEPGCLADELAGYWQAWKDKS